MTSTKKKSRRSPPDAKIQDLLRFDFAMPNIERYMGTNDILRLSSTNKMFRKQKFGDPPKIDRLSRVTELSPDLTQNIARYLGNSDIIRLTSANNIFRKFGHIDGKTVRNKALSDRDITTVGRNWMENQLEHERNIGGERENWEEEGGVDWEGERNPHYLKTGTFNPKFTENFLKNDVLGLGSWVPPVARSIRDRVLAQQLS